MNEVANFKISNSEAARMLTEAERLSKEIEQANERMRKIHLDIERSKTHTQAMLTELAELRAA
jgi:SMC interacting uncharacterized protein involved in chromosome segregation